VISIRRKTAIVSANPANGAGSLDLVVQEAPNWSNYFLPRSLNEGDKERQRTTKNNKEQR
jgi:hypothetical protein